MHRFRFSEIYNYLFFGLILILSFTMVGLSSWNVFDMFNLDYVNLEPVCYNASTNTQYYTIEGALKNAKSGEIIYTYIGKNPTIRKSVEIKSGVTLCLPFENTSNTWDGRQSGSDQSKWLEDCGGNYADANSGYVSKYRKNSLKVGKNVTLTNKGNLFIGGILGQEGTGLSGATSGNYCEIVMDSNSEIISTGTVKCYGYIKETEKNNNSKFIAQSGKVYAPFAIQDYRGGSSTVGSYQEGNITPFSVFSMPNIQVYSKYAYDSSLIGLADLYTGETSISKAQHNTTEINIIGTNSSLIILSGKDSYVETKYDSKSNLYTTKDDASSYTTKDDVSKTVMKFYGGASNGPMKMSVSIGGINKEISTSSVLFPISYKYDIFLYSGTYNFTTPIKLMNGSKLYIDDKATLNVNSDFIVYSQAFNDVSYGGSVYPLMPNAELIINGSITYNKSNGGLNQTLNTKSDFSYIYENSSTLQVESKEGYGISEKVFGFIPKFKFVPTADSPIKETAKAKTGTASVISVSNLAKTVYVSEKDKDYFVEATNLGKYTINYHLDGGRVDGEIVTNDIITKEYPILKDEKKTLTDYALSSPKKRFYSFSGWRRDSSTGESASGQEVKDGAILDVYASYELKSYSITYNVQYAEGLEMSDKYQNPNEKTTSFTLSNLPLDIHKPTDGTLEFYGWYFNGDTSKETLQITKDMEGVGYDDITLSGYFSDKTMCAVTFDANGHDDYFKNLASYNTVSNDPTKVRLPENSLYDDVQTKEYYLIGWEDPNGNILHGTLETFESKTLVLKAKWGNKFKLIYKDKDGNNTLSTRFARPNRSSQLLTADELDINDQNEFWGSVDQKVHRAIGWNFNGNAYSFGEVLNITSDIVFTLSIIEVKDSIDSLSIQATSGRKEAKERIAISYSSDGGKEKEITKLSSANSSTNYANGIRINDILIVSTNTDGAISSEPNVVGAEKISGSENLYKYVVSDYNVSISVEAASSSCLTSFSKILMADLTTKDAIDVKRGDLVMTYNHFKGKLEPSEVIINDDAEKEASNYDVLTLYFNDGNEISIVDEHGFFDMNMNKYAYITNSNYKEFIGHRFAKVDVNNNACSTSTSVLVSAKIHTENVKVCSPVSANNLNIVSDNMLSMAGGISGLFNIFDYEENSLKYDENKMQEDINKYGLLTYEDFKDMMPEELYNVLPCQYMAVAVGKGLITWEQINLYYSKWKYQLIA